MAYGTQAELVASFALAERPPVAANQPAGRPAAQPATKTQAAPTKAAPTSSSPPPVTTTTEPPPPSQPPTSAPPTLSPTDQVVALVNEARAAEGCPPLQVDARLTAAAAAHSADMSNRNYFSHTTPEGVKFDQRIEAAGHQSPGAENIAKGQKSAEEVMDAWMTSTGHRANILDCKLKTIGVGLAPAGMYWTQDFGR